MREHQTPKSDAPSTGQSDTTIDRNVPEEIAGKSGVVKVETEWILPTAEKWVRVSFVCKESEWQNYQAIAGNDVGEIVARETGLTIRELQVARVYTR
jgi:hypothetical protein